MLKHNIILGIQYIFLATWKCAEDTGTRWAPPHAHSAMEAVGGIII